MKAKNFLILVLALANLPACTHMQPQKKPKDSAKAADVPKKMLIPSLGVTLMVKEKSNGFPVAAIFDKNGDYYPELQNKMNKKMMESAQVGFHVVHTELLPEFKVYKESRESYATLIITATTVDGLNQKEKVLKFAVPVERMVITQRGEKTSGLGYWNTTDVRALDPQQALPF